MFELCYLFFPGFEDSYMERDITPVMLTNLGFHKVDPHRHPPGSLSRDASLFSEPQHPGGYQASPGQNEAQRPPRASQETVWSPGRSQRALTQLVHGTAVLLIKGQLHHGTGGLADLRLNGDRGCGTGAGSEPPAASMSLPFPAFSTPQACRDPKGLQGPQRCSRAHGGPPRACLKSSHRVRPTPLLRKGR